MITDSASAWDFILASYGLVGGGVVFLLVRAYGLVRLRRRKLAQKRASWRRGEPPAPPAPRGEKP